MLGYLPQHSAFPPRAERLVYLDAMAPGAKKGVEPMPLPRPRPRGLVEQHGRRPFRGAVQRLLLLIKNPKTQVGRFVGNSWTLARRSSCIHGRAVGTDGDILSFKFRLILIGLPKRGKNSFALGRRPASPARFGPTRSDPDEHPAITTLHRVSTRFNNGWEFSPFALQKTGLARLRRA